jgi:hypothetical protein
MVICVVYSACCYIAANVFWFSVECSKDPERQSMAAYCPSNLLGGYDLVTTMAICVCLAFV